MPRPNLSEGGPRWRRAFVLVGLALSLAACQAEERPDYPHGEGKNVPSVVYGEDRFATIHLPPRYETHPDARYPVLIVLDAPWMTAIAAAAAEELALDEKIPEMIVVGAVTPARLKEMTPPWLRIYPPTNNRPGEADKLLAHLKDELLPWLEQNYRTNGSFGLSGWSRGGVFSAWTLVAEPDLFDVRIPISPGFWRGDGEFPRKFREFFAENPDHRSVIHLSVGGGEGRKILRGYERGVSEFENAPEGLRWTSVILPGASHQDTPWEIFPRALEWAYGER